MATSHTVPTLGRLETVELKSVWTSEPYSFDPWLAQPENLQFLADALGLAPGLEVIHTQASVGPFYADIVAQIIGTDHKVIIENQLDKADHRHLGQVLTYAQHFDARICVWIAAQICDEHRAAVDWLNRVTGEGYAFFGVEVRAVRIGTSDPAPLFDVVAKPNEWSRVITTTTAAGEPVGAAATENEKYWSEFQGKLVAAGLPIRQATKPLRHGQYWIPIGLGSIGYLWAYRSQGKNPYIVSGVSLYGEHGNAAWHDLKQEAAGVQGALAQPVSWLSNEKQTAFHIQFDRQVLAHEFASWDMQHAFLISQLAKLNEHLVPHVKIAVAASQQQNL